MWGRKDKKDKRGDRKRSGGSKGGAGMPFMGLGVPPGQMPSLMACTHSVHILVIL